MKKFLDDAKKIIPVAVAAALLLGAVWGVLYGVLVAAVWLVFGAAMLLL